MHMKGIVHRNLYSSNILLDESGTIKINGFADACFIQESLMEELTLPIIRHLPPEWFYGINYNTTAIDIWEIGCLFYVLLTSFHFVTEENDKAIAINVINRSIGTPSESSWKGITLMKEYK